MADMFKKGTKCPITVRFSTVGRESGSSDLARDPRGFSVKFKTAEGNWDFVANNTPVFFRESNNQGRRDMANNQCETRQSSLISFTLRREIPLRIYRETMTRPRFGTTCRRTQSRSIKSW